MLRFPQHSHDEEARWPANQVSFVQADRVDPPNVLDKNHVTETTRPDFKLMTHPFFAAFCLPLKVEDGTTNANN